MASRMVVAAIVPHDIVFEVMAFGDIWTRSVRLGKYVPVCQSVVVVHDVREVSAAVSTVGVARVCTQSEVSTRTCGVLASVIRSREVTVTHVINLCGVFSAVGEHNLDYSVGSVRGVRERCGWLWTCQRHIRRVNSRRGGMRVAQVECQAESAVHHVVTWLGIHFHHDRRVMNRQRKQSRHKLKKYDVSGKRITHWSI